MEHSCSAGSLTLSEESTVKEMPAFRVDSEPCPTVDELITAKCSNAKSILNIILTAIGLGVITLPTVMAQCGWIGGIVVLFVSAVISDYMVCKLYSAIISHPKGEAINTYEELGNVCFGLTGKIITACIVHITMTGCAATLLLLLGENTQKLAPVVSTKTWVIIWAAVCVPLSWIRSLNQMSYVAFVGLLGVLTLFAIIAIKGIENGVTTTDDVQYDLFNGSPMEWAVSFGNSILSYQIASVTPTLVRDMKTPAAFPKVATVSFFLVFAIYLGVGACGYYGYGRDLIQVPIIDSIAPPGQSLDVWGYILVISMLALCLPHYLVLLMPIANSLEYAVRLDPNGTSKQDFIKRAIVRTALVAVTFVIAYTVPSVNKLINLMGVFTMIAMAGVLPALFYTRMLVLNGGSLKSVLREHWIEMSLLCALTLLCLLIMGAGGYETIVTF